MPASHRPHRHGDGGDGRRSSRGRRRRSPGASRCCPSTHPGWRSSPRTIWPKGAHENYARRDVHNTKVMDDLKMMVNTGKVNAKIPDALNNDRHAKLDELGKLWGQSFDDAYNRDQRESYQNEIGLFKQYAQNGDNPALRQWATKMLPELESNLIDAQRLG